MTGGAWDLLTSATAAVCVDLVFARAAAHKLFDLGSFTGFVEDYQVAPRWAVPTLSRVVVAAEAVVAVALTMPGLRGFGAYLAITMLLAYAVAIAVNIFRGRRQVECGCGGPPQPLGWSLVIRNIVLVGVAALVIVSDPSELSSGEVATSIAGGIALWAGGILIEQILANARLSRWGPNL